MDHYDVLGVAPGATPDEVHRAYRALARALHPDRHPGDAAAEEAMRMVNAAWAVLGDPVQRAAYDRSLADWSSAQAAARDMQVTPDPRAADLLFGLMTRHRPLRAGLAAFMLVVLFVIFVVTAYAGSGAR